MDPTHHDERLHYWAKRKGCAVLSLDYSKAPGKFPPYSSHINESLDDRLISFSRISLSICRT